MVELTSRVTTRRRELYRWMILARELERACAARNPRWFPAEGEEAAIVGTFFGLRPDDVIAPHYRGPFIAYLMREAELDRLIGQVLGKVNGYSKGRATAFSGPVQLNVVPWVAADLGTSLGVATGAALNTAYRREGGENDDRVVVVSFGDGTANRGDFHEAVNLAAVAKLPIVYVCQNNQYAISLPLPSYLAGPGVAARAAGYGIPGVAVDGNDPLAVNDAVQEAVARARRGEGPSLIEAQTYRLAGHWAEDAATYRSPEEVALWQARDPLARTRAALLAEGLSETDLAKIEREAADLVAASFARVSRLPDVGPAELGSDEVYHSVEARAPRPSVTPSPRPPAPRRTFAEAVVAAIADEMRADDRVYLIGQDVGKFGGAMSGSKGLYDEFGPRRIREAPISESAMVGAAVGAAMRGQRPIVEISFGEFLPIAMSQIVLQAANIHYMTAGEASVPLVLRTRIGDGPYRGHPQCYEAWFPHVPGLKVVMPAFPGDAYRLMRAAIQDPNPVLFFEHMQLYHAVHENVPELDEPLPIGIARIVREGSDATVVATGWLVHRALAVADRLAGEGISVEVIDPRSLAPLDLETILHSVRKTNRLVIAHEAWKIGGIGAEISAEVAEAAVDALDAPIIRIGAPRQPVPATRQLRDLFLPNDQDLEAGIRKVVSF